MLPFLFLNKLAKTKTNKIENKSEKNGETQPDLPANLEI